VWLVPIFLVFPSFGFINYCVLRASGATIPGPTLSLPILLGYCTVFFMASAEEVGLTGYAVDPLLERHSALTTSLVLGLVWAGYHVPGFLISGYYTADWIAWHAVYTVATRVLFVWIYNNSGRSLFSLSLCHWTFGLFWVFWPQDNLQKAVPFYDPRITATAATCAVVIVVYLWGTKTLARFRFARPEQAALGLGS
jgi:membrane protease YdiL (CAAX protease family)